METESRPQEKTTRIARSQIDETAFQGFADFSASFSAISWRLSICSGFFHSKDCPVEQISVQGIGGREPNR